MEGIVQSVTVFIAQLALIFLKHLNVRVIVEKRVIYSMLLTFGIQLSWLISSAIGINALINSDYMIVVTYLLGGVVGNYLNFKIKV